MRCGLLRSQEGLALLDIVTTQLNRETKSSGNFEDVQSAFEDSSADWRFSAGNLNAIFIRRVYEFALATF